MLIHISREIKNLIWNGGRKKRMKKSMKKSMLIMIAVLLVSALMISCNSDVSGATADTDTLVKVTVMADSSKAITVDSTSGTAVKDLYWFYKAEKTDGSIFITGDTNGEKKPVKKTSADMPAAGLENSDLGLFSTGDWKFSFWGYKTGDVSISDTAWSISDNAQPVYYQIDLTAKVVAKTDLTLTLVEGAGMSDATVVISSPTWTYELAGSGKELTLKVYDGETELDLNGSTTGKSVSATTDTTGKATFSGIVNQTLTSGAHTLYFKVFYNSEEVGSTSIGLNLKKGTTYTLAGDIEDLNETYHVWVTTVNQTTVVASTSEILEAQAVSIPATVTPLAAESSTAVSDAEKTTTVEFVSGALAHTTSTVTPADSDGKVTTTTTSSTHDLEVEVKTAASASSSTYVVEHVNTPIAGIDLTLTKNTTVTEVVTKDEQEVYRNTTTSSAVVNNFNNTYVTIRTYIAKNLSGVKVYYNGTSGEQPVFSEKDDFASAEDLNNYTDSSDSNKNGTGYVPSTGLLVFKTKHFSEFFVTSKVVARIGSGDSAVFFGSLQAAIDAAKINDTIVLIESISQSDGYIVNKSLKLDTNGKKITVSDGSNCNNRAFRVDKGTFEVYGNGTIEAVGSGTTSTNGTGCYGAFRVEKDGNLIAYDLILTNARPWGLNVKVLGGTATLTNVSITSSYGGGIEVTEANLGNHSKPGKATLTNCTFTQTGYFDHCSTTLSVSGGSELIVNSGTYTSENHILYVFSSGGTITVNGGTFAKGGDNVDSSKKGIVAGIDKNTYPEYTGGLNISGGSFTGGFDIRIPAFMHITGGTFDQDPINYVADDYVAKKQSTNPETWKVEAVSQAPLAIVYRYVKNNETQYASVKPENSEIIINGASEVNGLRHIPRNIDGDLSKAIDTGALVTFLPALDTRGMTSFGEDNDADKFYSNNKITRVISSINEDAWRAEFVIKSDDKFNAGDIGIVGYYGIEDIVAFPLPFDYEAGTELMVMKGVLQDFANAVTYDLLLGLCESENENEVYRPGFTCGAYVNTTDAKRLSYIEGKSITVQLVLTNDNMDGITTDNATVVVCAEVKCTFHPTVTTSTEI